MKIRLFIGKKYNPFQLKLPNKVFKKIISILIKLDIQCHFAMVFKNQYPLVFKNQYSLVFKNQY